MWQKLASLRSRVVILVLLSVLPAIGLTLYNGINLLRSAGQEASGLALEMSRDAVDEQNSLIAEAHQFLATLATLPQIKSGDLASCNQLLASLGAQFTDYQAIGVADSDGNLLCDSIPFTPGLNVSDRTYFMRVVQTHAFAIGDYQIGRVTGKPEIVFAYPLLNDQGGLQKVIFTALNLDWISSVFAQANLPQGSSILVIDGNGTYLAHLPDPGNWVGQSLPEDPLIKTILAVKGEGTLNILDADGVRRLYAFSPIYAQDGSGNSTGASRALNTPAAYVAVGIPDAVISAAANRTLYLDVIALGSLTLLALGVAWIFGNAFILRPVRAMLSATHRLAAGDFSARTGLTQGGEELKQLADSFDQMAEHLQLQVAEREHLLMQLEKERALWRTTVESMPDPVTVCDERGVATYMNNAYTELLNLTIDPALSLEGHPAYYHISNPDGTPIKAEDLPLQKAAFKDDVVHDVEIVHHIPGGQNRIMLFNAAPLHNGQNQVIGAVAVGRDITEQRLAEDALRQSLEALERRVQERTAELSQTNQRMAEEISERRLVEAALRKSENGLALAQKITHLGSWDWEIVKNELHWSDEMYRIFGEDPQSFGATYEAFLGAVHPDDRMRVDEAVKLALSAQQPYNLDLQVCLPDGKVKIVHAQGEVIFDPDHQPIRMVGSLQDITLRKNLEDKYRIVADNTSDWEFWLSPEGQFYYNSPSCEQITGYTTHDFETDPILFYRMIHPDDQAKMEAHKAEVKNTSFHGILEYRIVRRDGEVRWIGHVCRRLTDATGNFIGTRGSNRDVTDRKQAEGLVRQNAARAEALAHIASRLNAQLDLQTVLNTACEETAQSLGLNACMITLFDPDSRQVRLAASHGLPPEFLQDHAFLPLLQYEKMIGQISQASTYAEFHQPTHRLEKEYNVLLGSRSILGVNLAREKQFIGNLIVISNSDGYRYTENDISLLKGLADQIAQAITNANLYASANRRLQYVQTLREIDLAIIGSIDLRVAMKMILEQTVTQLHVDAASFYLYNAYTRTLEFVVGRGFHSHSHQNSRIPLGEGFAGKAALDRRTIHIPDLATGLELPVTEVNIPMAPEKSGLVALSPLESTFKQFVLNEGFRNYFAVPLIAKGQVKGILEIYNRSLQPADLEWQDFLDALAGQAAIAIDNATLFNELQHSNLEMMQAYDATLEGWSRALDLRDQDTEGHTQRVAEMTVRLARAMGLSESECVQMRRGALLHDIGKMAIPDAILHKPGPLTEDERAIMRCHTMYAFQMLSAIAFLRPAIDIPCSHHEWWDGTGYPQKLKGLQIPLSARIFAVVDVWDALRSDRPYRKAWPEDKVHQYLRDQAGIQFDPQVVEPFLALLAEGEEKELA